MSANQSSTRGRLSSHAHRLAWLWLRGLLAVAGIVAVGVVSILLGFNAFIGDSPVVELVHLYPVASIVVAVILIGVTLLAIVVARESDSSDKSKDPKETFIAPRLAIATGLASLSTSLFIALLLIVLIRPTWCPSALCRPDQVSYNPGGVHDSNMEVYLTAFPSRFYAIEGNPSNFGLQHLPSKSIAAVSIDPSNANADSCSIFIGVHNVRDTGYAVLIEQVHLIIQEVPELPSQLNVWQPGDSRLFHGNPYEVTYRGELPGTLLQARYLAAPVGFVQLVPHETDEIELRLSSTVPADLRFAVEVIYRIANESDLHALTLPQNFEVAFSNSSNWHPYELVNGQFVPSKP